MGLHLTQRTTENTGKMEYNMNRVPLSHRAQLGFHEPLTKIALICGWITHITLAISKSNIGCFAFNKDKIRL